MVSFSAKSVWEACRHRNSFQPWYSVVWSSQGMPRWSFIMWLAVLGILSTKDRLVNWGLVVPPLCSFCLTDTESHSYLFFDCQFSSLVWKQVLTRNGIARPIEPLAQELDWAVHHRKGKNLRDSLYKLSLAASIYTLWGKRNMRIFQGKSRNEGAIALDIFNSVRTKVIFSFGFGVLVIVWPFDALVVLVTRGMPL
ncbi:uncharacterized protein LOC131302775 [Rhododendron vialii]|uniref:uncharacterized protein LOC131302775 n=1 Tax=Rhododendron vialii TaxID=182163 RepID=UPI00265E3749|nr:uncharacterized protein LOC131302775 [Rhododendron vialii]